MSLLVNQPTTHKHFIHQSGQHIIFLNKKPHAVWNPFARWTGSCLYGPWKKSGTSAAPL